MKPRSVILCIAAVTLGILAACSGVNVSLGGGRQNQAGMAGSTKAGGAAATGNGPSSGLKGGDAGMAPPPCLAGQNTTVSGTVYDPAGNPQLYNAVVYIPDGTPPPFPQTVACETCKDPVQAVDV